MDFLGQETSRRIARFGWYRYKRYPRMGSFLFMELVKAIGCCNRQKHSA
jgi:hypothetical protein